LNDGKSLAVDRDGFIISVNHILIPGVGLGNDGGKSTGSFLGAHGGVVETRVHASGNTSAEAGSSGNSGEEVPVGGEWHRAGTVVSCQLESGVVVELVLAHEAGQVGDVVRVVSGVGVFSDSILVHVEDTVVECKEHSAEVFVNLSVHVGAEASIAIDIDGELLSVVRLPVISGIRILNIVALHIVDAVQFVLDVLESFNRSEAVRLGQAVGELVRKIGARWQ